MEWIARNGDIIVCKSGCYCYAHLFVEDAVHEEYHNPLQGHKHKEDPLHNLNVCWIIPKDQESRDPAESQHRIQNDSCSKRGTRYKKKGLNHLAHMYSVITHKQTIKWLAANLLASYNMGAQCSLTLVLNRITCSFWLT